MKVTFNLGAIKTNTSSPAFMRNISQVTRVDGVKLEKPIDAHVSEEPAKNFTFEMEASAFTFECEPGELPAIYKEVMPTFDKLIAAFAMHQASRK